MINQPRKGRRLMKAVDFVGTVSHATMRPEDLIPAFMQVLETYWPEKAEELQSAYSIRMGDDDDYWHLEELINALNELAPAGYFFGAHPADYSDYGFWPIEE